MIASDLAVMRWRPAFQRDPVMKHSLLDCSVPVAGSLPSDLMIRNVHVAHEIFRGTVDPAVSAVGQLLAVGRPLPALEQAEVLLATGHGDCAVLVGAVRLAVQAICHELAEFDADRNERFAGHDAAWFMAKQTEIEIAYLRPALLGQHKSAGFSLVATTSLDGQDEQPNMA